MSHENGYGHIAHHDNGGNTRPGANHNQYRCQQLCSQREVSDETGKSQSLQHSLYERDTVDEFVYSVKKHQSAYRETEQQQSQIAVAKKVFIKCHK